MELQALIDKLNEECVAHSLNVAELTANLVSLRALKEKLKAEQAAYLIKYNQLTLLRGLASNDLKEKQNANQTTDNKPSNP